jgi:ATP-dependent Clp protease ATP-binding subunit ClpA
MEKYNVTVQLDDPKALFLAIGSLAGVQNGGRGLLNIMETKLVNPLSAFIFAETESLSPGKTIRIQVLDKKTAIFDFEII